jgi:cytoskeleton protein RodZ
VGVRELGGSGQGPGAGPEAPTAAPPREVAAASVTVTMRATAEVWTRVTVDGRVAYEGTLVAGDRRSFTARRALDLHLGNAGGVQLTVDGRSRGAPGRSGQVWRGRFVPDGGRDR